MKTSTIVKITLKLLEEYPKCSSCVYCKDGKCTLPIVEYKDLSEVSIACPKDKVVLEIKEVLRSY